MFVKKNKHTLKHVQVHQSSCVVCVGVMKCSRKGEWDVFSLMMVCFTCITCETTFCLSDGSPAVYGPLISCPSDHLGQCAATKCEKGAKWPFIQVLLDLTADHRRTLWCGACSSPVELWAGHLQ